MTSGLLLVLWGIGTGIVVGLCVVNLLALLGLHVDTGTVTLLRRVFLP